MREEDDPVLEEEDADEFAGDAEDASSYSDVDSLIAEFESETLSLGADTLSARRRLELMLEEKRIAREMSDYDDFDLD